MHHLSILLSIDRAVATHLKGVACLLHSRLDAWMRSTRLPSLWQQPRLIARSLIRPNRRSTWLSRDEWVGVQDR